jgi:hypothetical protein
LIPKRKKTKNQLVDNFQAVVDRLRDGGMGCDNLIDSIINQLDRPANGNTPSGENSLRLELAIIKDTGVMIAIFTNAMEGDGFLAPDAFDAWHAVLDHVNNVIGKNGSPPVVPTVTAVAKLIAQNDVAEQDRLVKLTVAKAVIVAQKLESDSLGRFRDTLNILEGCRTLNFRFVEMNTIEALHVAIQSVQFIPSAVPLFGQLQSELVKYKKTDKCDLEMDTWAFWRTYYLELPVWYKVAAEVALIMVSSAGVERVFSMLNNFSKQQQNALNDYKEASVRIRYNENFRNKNFGY